MDDRDRLVEHRRGADRNLRRLADRGVGGNAEDKFRFILAGLDLRFDQPLESWLIQIAVLKGSDNGGVGSFKHDQILKSYMSYRVTWVTKVGGLSRPL